MENLNETKLYSKKELSQIFHVHPSTIDRWWRNGKLPFVRTMGGHRRTSGKMIREIFSPKTNNTLRLDCLFCEKSKCCQDRNRD